ncbi:hypothetical protein PHISP_06813 [Aspergillus sp. HF37]|nr:hypothetical protein PHISP_06813 [Aspergillus sp. HF37]
MAKSKSQSAHSRAARRESSPSVDIDKSLTSLPRIESDVQRDSVLAERVNAGVTKKKPKQKSKSRTQRLRQEKGSERAEIVMDQLEKKVAGSVKRGKTVNARRADWDNLNRTNTSKFEALQAQSADDAPNEDNDTMDDGSAAPVSKNPVSKPPQAFQLPQEAQESLVGQDTGADEDDEIT